MKIVILNGSPKGEDSITLQSARFVGKHHPEHEWTSFPVAQRIAILEKDPAAFDTVVKAVRQADLVLWAFPLYVFLVHAGYKRFIELVEERGVQKAFAGKYAAAISTSIRFYDHTAHRYIHAVCDDLDMKYAGFFSAKMNDLLDSKEQKRLLGFAQDVLQTVTTGRPVQKAYPRLSQTMPTYVPGPAREPIEMRKLRLAIVTDGMDTDQNLGRMVTRLSSGCSEQVLMVDLQQLEMKGQCLGCIQCGADNQCVHDTRDNVRATYEQLMGEADLIVFCGMMKDRYLSARWKQFVDRRFFFTHQRMFTGKQIAWVISGPASENANLTDVLQAMSEWDLSHLVDVVTDEETDSAELDARLDGLIPRMAALAEAGYVRPVTFLGHAGMKVFRDEIWGGLRMVFPMDHKAFRRTGVYDFPHRQWPMRLLNGVMLPVLRIPAVKRGMQSQMIRQMVARHQQLVEGLSIGQRE